MSVYEFIMGLNSLYPDNSTRTLQQISKWLIEKTLDEDEILYFYNFLQNECGVRKMFIEDIKKNYRFFVESIGGQDFDHVKKYYHVRELGRYKTPNQLCNMLFLYQKYPERYDNESEMDDFYEIWQDMLQIRAHAIKEKLRYEEIQDVLWNVKKDILSNIAVSIFYEERLLSIPKEA